MIAVHNILAALAISFGLLAGFLFSMSKNDNFGAAATFYLFTGLALVCGAAWIVIALVRWTL